MTKEEKAAYDKLRYADPVIRQQAIERARANRAKPGYNENYRAYKKNWKKQNPGKHESYTSPEQMKAYKTKYNRTEKGRLSRKQNAHKRRARIKQVTVGPVNFAKILQEAEGLCQLCFEPLSEQVHFDHIFPLAKGGSHTEDNLQATHPSCNRSKGARIAA